jgi:hypothetical protein
MKTARILGVQGLVCALVAAAVTNLYLTQPVLHVLAAEFGAAARTPCGTVVE